MEKFPCTGCGMCCKNIGPHIANAKRLVAEKGIDNGYVKEVADFPFGFTETGACENLLPDNSCAVYENRPSICSVEQTWKKHHSKSITKDNYFISTMMICNSLMVEGGIDENFFIDINGSQSYPGV